MALADFEHKDAVQITWHSFQLDPSLVAQPGKSIYQYLAERKGQSLEWSVNAHNQLRRTAAEVGLDYHFEKTIVANSFDAHRLIHLAGRHGAADAAKEALMRAYFTEGWNIADHNTLMQIAIDLGLGVIETGEMLNSDEFATNVLNDMEQAERYGINGVPFFLFDLKYAISGAQPVTMFRSALETAWNEQHKPAKV